MTTSVLSITMTLSDDQIMSTSEEQFDKLAEMFDKFCAVKDEFKKLMDEMQKIQTATVATLQPVVIGDSEEEIFKEFFDTNYNEVPLEERKEFKGHGIMDFNANFKKYMESNYAEVYENNKKLYTRNKLKDYLVKACGNPNDAGKWKCYKEIQ